MPALTYTRAKLVFHDRGRPVPSGFGARRRRGVMGGYTLALLNRQHHHFQYDLGHAATQRDAWWTDPARTASRCCSDTATSALRWMYKSASVLCRRQRARVDLALKRTQTSRLRTLRGAQRTRWDNGRRRRTGRTVLRPAELTCPEMFARPRRCVIPPQHLVILCLSRHSTGTRQG
jgi:hypothetical protein